MTPGERDAVLELSARLREGLVLNINERTFIEKLAGRIARDMQGGLIDREARYLRQTAAKQNIEISEDPSGTAREAPSTLEGREASALDVGTQSAGPSPQPAVENDGGHHSVEEPRRSAELVRYNAAKTALAAAASIDEVKDVRDKAAAIQAYAEMAEDPELEQNAAEIRLRAERKLGEAIGEARDAGRIHTGPKSKKKDIGSGSEPIDRITLSELGVDKKLSAFAQKLAEIPPEVFETTVKRMRDGLASGKRSAAKNVVREAAQGGPVNGARSVMGSRVEPPDSLDYFPTPPWATRALIENALPELGIARSDLLAMTAEEPACGEGHISGVLEEYFRSVQSTDVFDYCDGDAKPPGWIGTRDFLAGSPLPDQPHWIITNPPFEEKATQFVLRALDQAKCGVAMFFRLQWLETLDRYEAIFCDKPPTLIAFFVERVNLCKGRWDPKGSTATAYVWLVWVKGEKPRAPFWIPPKRREELTRADDVERFTAHPCLPYRPSDEAGAEPETSVRAWRDPSSGEIRGGEVEDIPPELRRPLPEAAE